MLFFMGYSEVSCMQIRGEKARQQVRPAADLIREKFSFADIKGGISAQYVSFGKTASVLGVSGLRFDSPFTSTLLEDEGLYEFFKTLFENGRSLLITYDNDILAYTEDGKIDLPEDISGKIRKKIEDSEYWGGILNENGELIADPSTPAPGPHYYTNLLIGNRIGFDRPLQSTPKSAIDRLGGGCFRAHADTQVLATRWDYLPEENGFPANRQFYLTEDGKEIFYSGRAKADNLLNVKTVHSQNRTEISYVLSCGLKIKRTIFILPQEDKLPLAAEAQMIEIANDGGKDRDLRIVYTGMFGTSEVHALREDVIFSTVVAESEVFFDENEDIAAISFNPNPKWTKGNIRFSTLLIHEDGKVKLPSEYCAKYSEFVGNGSLEEPEFISHLSCRPSRKGPGFFALGASFKVKAGSTVRADNFTCLSSDKLNPDFKDDVTVKEEIGALISRFSDEKSLPEVLDKLIKFTKDYAGYMKISHEDRDFEAYVNNNLPFQVFYQTFVSRSLDWTQKGYREIGFREIQDIFASMYYFQSMGQQEFVRKLLREWAGNVHKDGFANHNFYWTGKEPGWWSDDALWLLQALDRYVSLTGDYAFLEEELPVAGTEGEKRSILDTIKAIITYSAKISVGKHGIPLIDRADWNDCLRVDPDCIGGSDKIEAYKEQLKAKGRSYGEVPFESEYSESVMNGFLLKVAVDAASKFFTHFGDSYAGELKELSGRLYKDLNENAWKNDFFARVLFNRKDKPELKYLGAAGDNLQVEDAPGSYFLNSFSWSILSGCASEDQISSMLDSMDKYLKSPYGFRLCSTVEYSKIAPKIDVALYYPGDRENGGVFKHANMMAAAAMLKAAKEVEDDKLAERLLDEAYWVIDRILPYKTLKSPFATAGNPRLCTQYNNCQTGENIGPTLSGTSTWLLLCLFSCFGVEFTSENFICEPLLRKEDRELEVTVNNGKAVYKIRITKSEGFRRTKNGVAVTVDGVPQDSTKIGLFEDGKEHEVRIEFK